MFSSSSNNGYNPFEPFITGQTRAETRTSYAPKEHPSSTTQNNLLPFLHYPHEAFLDNGNDFLMSQLLSQQQEILGSCCTFYSNSGINNAIVSPGKDTKKIGFNNSGQKKKKKGDVGVADGDGAITKHAVPRKRGGRKDRHSKIYTAQGPRDRRMRLSVQIARKFFGLQDMLGFDRASKTIEWLFSKSRASIKELKEVIMASSAGTSEQHKGAMEIDEAFTGSAQEREKIFESKAKEKESRDRARARARERTMKKMKVISGLEMSKLCSGHQETTSNDLDRLGSSSSQETCEDLGSCNQEMKTSIKLVAEGKKEEEFSNIYMLEHQMDSVSIIEKFLGITSEWSSSSIFDYSNNIRDSVGMNSEDSYYAYLSGNWNISNDGVQSINCAESYYAYLSGNFQVQNPINAVLATNQAGIDQNPNSSPMASSTIKKLNTASAFMNNSQDEERNPNQIFIYDDYLNY